MITNLRKYRWLLRWMGCIKIPMIGWVKPKLIALDDQQVRIQIKLRRRTSNHLNSMYLGALTVGADCAAGLAVFYFSDRYKAKPSFAFKGMEATFLKRVETTAYFECNEVERIHQLVHRAMATSERQQEWVTVTVMNQQAEIVALFKMEISVKLKTLTPDFN